MFPTSAGYDRAITVFSPDGRLYQVEYAIETVKRGTLSIGIKCPEGVLLAVEEKTRKLQESSVSQKLFQIDDHIIVAAAGYIPDARVQVDRARITAQQNRLVYDEPIDVEVLAKSIADLAQQYTQYAGVRPFGISLIIAGVDRKGPSIYLTDPSGTYLGYLAVAIGAGSDQVMDFLEKNYRPDMSMEEAGILAVKAIYLVSGEKEEGRHIKMAVVGAKDKKARFLSEEEIKRMEEKARG